MAFERRLKTDEKVGEKNEVLLYEGDGLMSAEQLTKSKNAVCMLRFQKKLSGRHLKKCGSGFYAKAKIFGCEYRCIVTNHHVISCEADAAVAVALFHFEQENQGIAVRLRPDKLFETNLDLDYSVIGVDEEEINRLNPRVFPIEFTEQPQAAAGEDIFIFQHPRGGPKQFSYEKIIGIQDPYVYYKADTDDGSSGSPVLWRLQLMAVHRTGNVEDGYNKGILFSAIINDLHVGKNFNHFYSVNTLNKRDHSFVTRNAPKEMDENFSKRICVENNKNDVEVSKGPSIGDEAKSPSDEMLDKLSQECSGFYKKLGRRLEVKHEKIEEISRDNVNNGSLSEKCFQVLHEWKESNSTQATSEVLECALRSLDKNALANKYFGRR
ncbi:uncharacterized protein LOC114517867 [Dendronephthya gigantea]|uniref:uncharacterized protein LOC114517867 n=1 Tax=Dendronephthya gigantea TaxID=151771 RepID=UPI00106B7FDC|nr:uncharacterized protein LOC114517867 [Dendronephthya gigantea]